MMNSDKYNSVKIASHINEILAITEIIQNFKNVSKNPIELSIKMPVLSNCTIIKFEMNLGGKKVISKILEKEKAKEKYNDSISNNNYSFLSYNEEKETTVSLGNIPANQEIELKTYYLSNIICKDFSYQVSFPVIFPKFLIQDITYESDLYFNEYVKKDIYGKIYINTFSKLNRLVINGSSNFDKIEKKYDNSLKSVEIDFYKKKFSEKDIPGIILFRTEKINENTLYYQYDSILKQHNYLAQITVKKPKFNYEQNKEKNIDEDENIKYISLLKNEEKTDNPYQCYIFLLDQSGSMKGRAIELCRKSLLLFLYSLNKNSYFQLIGFGYGFEYYNEKPLQYTKENVNNLINIIKKLDANKGGTNLYSVLQNIFQNSIYNELKMSKHIFLLTDGEIQEKENTLNLIGSYSDKFNLHCLGIGDCDLDLIKRSAIIGNGFSYYINDLNNLNKTTILALENSQKLKTIICDITNNYKDKTYIECNMKDYNGINDFMKYGFIFKNKNININEIELLLKININENDIIKEKIRKFNIKKLPDGDKLGKVIIYNYLKKNNTIDQNIQIKLSKEFNILSPYTAFYAEIQNKEPMNEKLITYTNKDSKAINNINEDNNFELKDFGYDKNNNDINENEDKNKITTNENNNKENGYIYSFFSYIFSYFWNYKKNNNENKIFVKNIINININQSKNNDLFNYCLGIDSLSNNKQMFIKRKCKKSFISNVNYLYNDNNKYKDISKGEEIKNIINIDEMILGQDIFEGNWSNNNNEIKLLIEEENNIYEKIKKYSENKGINEENGIITLLVLYYIFNKKPDKVEELKFIINKAKIYIRNIYGLDYEDIVKEI